MLIRYSLDSKSYHCYHRATHKVFVSYNVSFIESHQSSNVPLHLNVTINNSGELLPSPTQQPTVEDVPDEHTTPSQPC
jgi:hypothetical protein